MADGDSPLYSSHYLILSGGGVVIVCSCCPSCIVLSLRLVKVREPSSGEGVALSQQA